MIMAYLSKKTSLYVLQGVENHFLHLQVLKKQLSCLVIHCNEKRKNFNNKHHPNTQKFHRFNHSVPPAPESESQSRLWNKGNSLGRDTELQSEDRVIMKDNHNEIQDSVSYDGHIPVLVKETLTSLSPKDNQLIVDMTFGGGGHSRHIMKSAANLRYIAADRDPLAYKKAVDFASNFSKGQVVPLLSRFSELAAQLSELGIVPGTVDSFFMDLGASSMQFDSSQRGFSLSRDGPLDMRMDGERFPNSPTAADVVNSLNPADLGKIIKKYGEESHAIKIAHAIVEARYAFGKFSRTSELANVIKAVFDSYFRHDKLHRHAHVATKTFQALRIFVNNELNEIHNGLEVARHFLKPGGRCVAISFHSLEDRIVKRHFHEINMDDKPSLSSRQQFRNANVSYDIDEIKENYLSGSWQPLSRKVTEATEEEVVSNPRARSAKLRAALKTKKS